MNQACVGDHLVGRQESCMCGWSSQWSAGISAVCGWSSGLSSGLCVNGHHGDR